jgi:LacI family transcriptional regulator
MNLKSLAKHLNLSASTVSRVLAGRGDEFRISKETQKLIFDQAAEQRVQPDELARSLRLRSTRTIGLLIPDIANPFFASLAKAVEQQARAAGYAMLIADSRESCEVEAACAQVLYHRRVDGIIIAPVGGQSAHLTELLAKDLPMTQMDRVLKDLPIPSVTTDNYAAVQMAVQHLTQLGHKRIACVQGRNESSANRDRVQSYLDAMQAANLPVKKDWIVGTDYSASQGEVAARAILSLRQRPTAIIAMGNLLALGTLHVAQQKKLKIPDDLALLAFDEAPWATLLQPAITTLAQPVAEMGQQAFQALLAVITKQPLSTSNVVLPPRFVIRGSTQKVEA